MLLKKVHYEYIFFLSRNAKTLTTNVIPPAKTYGYVKCKPYTAPPIAGPKTRAKEPTL